MAPKTRILPKKRKSISSPSSTATQPGAGAGKGSAPSNVTKKKVKQQSSLKRTAISRQSWKSNRRSARTRGNTGPDKDVKDDPPLDATTQDMHDTIEQAYSVRVTPHLRRFTQGGFRSPTAWGDILPTFMHEVFMDVNLTKRSLFVDLGCGVGNIVVQAALERSCRSFGCELVKERFDVAEKFRRETAWRLEENELTVDHLGVDYQRRLDTEPKQTARVRIEQGDMFDANAPAREWVAEADLVLCANFTFSPDMDAQLLEMAKTMKTGGKMMTLRQILLGRSTNAPDDPSKLLDVEQLRSKKGHVSWTATAVDYFMYTRK